MFKIPTILLADEILDKIYHKASKITENKNYKNRLKRRRDNVLAKLDSVTDTLDSTIGKYITAFPSFNQLPKFQFELIHVILDVDKIRKSLGAIEWARGQVNKLKKKIYRKVSKIYDEKKYSKIEELRITFYGRTASIINQVSDELKFLNQARDKIKKLPAIDTETKTVVVAGFPNVGKSLLVKNISTGKPRVATYPFTTQQLNVGHLNIGREKIQIIDTPGLLDRTFEERNNIERQAIMALQYLADLIIFILDPSEHCGYLLSEQKKLLNETQTLFKNITIITIENKIDIKSTSSDNLQISAQTGQGLEELMEVVEMSLR